MSGAPKPKKVNFELDSVVPTSSKTAFALGLGFAIYGLTTGSPVINEPTLKEQIEEKKKELGSVEENIGNLESQLSALKSQSSSLRTTLGV